MFKNTMASSFTSNAMLKQKGRRQSFISAVNKIPLNACLWGFTSLRHEDHHGAELDNTQQDLQNTPPTC